MGCLGADLEFDANPVQRSKEENQERYVTNHPSKQLTLYIETQAYADIKTEPS